MLLELRIMSRVEIHLSLLLIFILTLTTSCLCETPKTGTTTTSASIVENYPQDGKSLEKTKELCASDQPIAGCDCKCVTKVGTSCTRGGLLTYGQTCDRYHGKKDGCWKWPPGIPPTEECTIQAGTCRQYDVWACTPTDKEAIAY